MPQNTDPVLGPLNDRQRQAVMTLNGPLLILAGAGSGKTRALTHRIAHLIDQGVPPWQILAVTFTNKAAQEMKQRIGNLLHIVEGTDPFPSPFGGGAGVGARLPVMGTFHSVCVRILRRDIEHLGFDRRFVIYDADDQEKVMKEVLKEMKIDDATLKPRAVLAHMTRFKAEALHPKEVKLQASSERMHLIADCYTRYQQFLRKNSALDFDDLILETVRLFHECPDVLGRYQNTWRFLNVDEYQDTNHAQYLLITLLAAKERNLCVIGDPDQSIYGFRGADIRNILEFKKEYPDAVQIALEQNYRSTQPILDAADQVIAANPNRPQKKMWTERTGGAAVIVHELQDEKGEATEAIRSVEEMLGAGVPLREQVILYRTHAQSRLFEEACMRNSLPYRILGGVKFYSRREVKDVLAYLHVILNPYDTVSLLRILNVPSRKIGETTLGYVHEWNATHKLPLWDVLKRVGEIPALEGATASRIGKFVAVIEDLHARASGMVVSVLTEYLIDVIGLKAWLDDGTDEGEQRWQNVLELLTVTHKYDALEPLTSLQSFLEEVALVSEVDKLDSGKDALTLMTLHLCKGLEFDHVVITGCEEGIFPHSSSLFDAAQLEEERRIMYVGMTRAKSRLRMLFTRSRFLWGNRQSNAPSRFLDDLPDRVERRSDELLSAFAWSYARGQEVVSRMQDASRAPKIDAGLEFNQDTFSGVQSQDPFEQGTRIEHPVFGAGIILARRGDIVDIKFDSGQQKTFALSIAPLRVL